jgi:hypothetical protein
MSKKIETHECAIDEIQDQLEGLYGLLTRYPEDTEYRQIAALILPAIERLEAIKKPHKPQLNHRMAADD